MQSPEAMVPSRWGRSPGRRAATLQLVQSQIESGAPARMMTMMPLRRPGWPDEVAKAILFLASDLGSYISGANIVVDGAQSLR